MKRLLAALALSLVTAPAAYASQTPVLAVSGTTLHWTGTAKTYVLERKPGPSFTELSGHEYAASVGQYRVRYKANPLQWSNEVTVGEPHEEPPGEHVVGRSPIGPPIPSSGWHIAYADAFGKPLSEDPTLESSEKWNGCCTNSNEVAVEQRSQARVGAEGLELICSLGSFTVEGHTRGASCGGVRGDAFMEFAAASVGEWAVECYVRMPVDEGGADPGFWIYPSASGEIDFFELWGWNGTSWASANGGMPVVVGQGEHELSPVDSLGFDPSLAFHRYTTAFVPEGAGRYDVREYIDGTFRWDLPGRTVSGAYDGLILTNGLRVHVQADVMTVRSIAFWQDGAHTGVGIKGGGIAPGTTVK